MIDDELRTAERAWLEDPSDHEVFARYMRMLERIQPPGYLEKTYGVMVAFCEAAYPDLMELIELNGQLNEHMSIYQQNQPFLDKLDEVQRVRPVWRVL